MPHRESSPRARAREKLNACIRALYEDTLVPVREIARLVGITERNLYLTVRRLGCRPRMRVAPGGGRRLVPLCDAPPATHASGGLDAAGVRRAERAVRRAAERQRTLAAAALADREARIARKNLRRKGEADLHALTQLSRARRELVRLAAAEKARADTHARTTAEESARTEALRRELARKFANLARDTPAPDRSAAETAKAPVPRDAPGARIRLVSD